MVATDETAHLKWTCRLQTHGSTSLPPFLASSGAQQIGQQPATFAAAGSSAIRYRCGKHNSRRGPNNRSGRLSIMRAGYHHRSPRMAARVPAAASVMLSGFEATTVSAEQMNLHGKPPVPLRHCAFHLLL
jgi:hypothetical protein